MPWQNTRINEGKSRNRARETIPRRFSTRLHELFLSLCAHITGIDEIQVRQRYAACFLHRLMFIYFIQHLGLLAGKYDYLGRKYAAQRASEGSFFRKVLSPLLRAQKPWPDFPLPLAGLCAQHEIEQCYPTLDIADEFFEDAFALFDQYRWSLNEHLEEAHNVLTPHILGVLFTFDAPQPAMGIHYTPREVATFLAHNTLPLAFFRRASELCPPKFQFERWLWRTLTCEPQRFLYPAVSHGYAKPLPPEIIAGITDVAQRVRWSEQASSDYGLSGETWRDVVTRRAHLDELLAQMRQDEPVNFSQLLSWNVNLPALARAMLCSCSQPELLLACYQGLRRLSVLDPTCGSGAFLCAALPLLHELFLVCLERMEALCAENPVKLAPHIYRTFQTYLAEMGSPTHRAYQSLRWIIEQSLYGVDLDAEAIEICRQRLYLKLLAALPRQQCLPSPESICQHIRVGNSLRGSLSASPTRASSHDPPGSSCVSQDFHWEQAFPLPIQSGGFDVVLGNPPYVEYERVRLFYELEGYTTLETGNLYAPTVERATQLLAPGGQCGMLVPTSATSTYGYRSLQRLLLAQQALHIASFSDQRGHLLALPHPRLCMIFYTKPSASLPQHGRVFTTPYLKIGTEAHSSLFQHLNYTEVTSCTRAGLIPRFGSRLEVNIYQKLARQKQPLGAYRQHNGIYPIYFTRKLSWYVQVTPFIPQILDAQGQPRMPSELKSLAFASSDYARLAFAALNSNLFYWLITTGSDCRNLNMREVLSLPLDLATIAPDLQRELLRLANELEADLLKHAHMKPMLFRQAGYLTIQCLYPACSRSLIDEIDGVLARHLDLNQAELDFLLHYDEKYRRSTRA